MNFLNIQFLFILKFTFEPKMEIIIRCIKPIIGIGVGIIGYFNTENYFILSEVDIIGHEITSIYLFFWYDDLCFLDSQLL